MPFIQRSPIKDIYYTKKAATKKGKTLKTKEYDLADLEMDGAACDETVCMDYKAITRRSQEIN